MQEQSKGKREAKKKKEESGRGYQQVNIEWFFFYLEKGIATDDETNVTQSMLMSDSGIALQTETLRALPRLVQSRREATLRDD